MWGDVNLTIRTFRTLAAVLLLLAGTSLKADAQTAPAPTVTSVTPDHGPVHAETPVTITGTNFAPGAVVTFDGQTATNVVVVSPTSITATAPSALCGNTFVGVSVKNLDGRYGTLFGGFTYTTTGPAPIITSLTPNNGPGSGGTVVTITGVNFVSGAKVSFVETPPTNATVVNTTTMTVTTPAIPGMFGYFNGPGPVRVINPGGLCDLVMMGFTFTNPRYPTPTVSGVTPDRGPSTGGTEVTITGTNFTPGATVSFGGQFATNVTFVSSTSLRATTPPGPSTAFGPIADPVWIEVKNPDGQFGTLGHGFSYYLPTATNITGISPKSGPISGGTAVTISGENFGAGMEVVIRYVNGAEIFPTTVYATDVVVASATSASAVMPPGPTGAVDVVARAKDWMMPEGKLVGGFTYFDPSTAVDLSLESGGAANLQTGGAAESLSVGYATVDLKSDVAPSGMAVFRHRQNGVTLAETSVPVSSPTTQARFFIDYRKGVEAVPGRTDSGIIDINTGIAVVNSSLADANVTYTLRDTGGIVVAVGHGTIAGRTHFSCFIDQLKQAAAPDFDLPSGTQLGSLEIYSDQSLSVLAIRGIVNQRNEFLFNTLPVADLTQPLDSNPGYFPEFLDGGGYATSLILLNTSDVLQKGTLEMLTENGDPLVVNQAGKPAGSSFPYEIPAGGVFRFQTDGSASTAKVGWVRLIADSPNQTPIGAVILSYNPNGILISESGMPAAASMTHARINLDLSGNHNTALAIANIQDVQATITVKAFEKDGMTSVGTSQGPLLVAAYGHASGFADHLVSDLPAGFAGVLDISSATPFSAVTLRSLDNERHEFLFTMYPIADSNQAATAPVIFPEVAQGGGYDTEFILISAGAAVSAVLSGYDERGTPIKIAR